MCIRPVFDDSMRSMALQDKTLRVVAEVSEKFRLKPYMTDRKKRPCASLVHLTSRTACEDSMVSISGFC
jgi:hypothetical protein